MLRPSQPQLRGARLPRDLDAVAVGTHPPIRDHPTSMDRAVVLESMLVESALLPDESQLRGRRRALTQHAPGHLPHQPREALERAVDGGETTLVVLLGPDPLPDAIEDRERDALVGRRRVGIRPGRGDGGGRSRRADPDQKEERHEEREQGSTTRPLPGSSAAALSIAPNPRRVRFVHGPPRPPPHSHSSLVPRISSRSGGTLPGPAPSSRTGWIPISRAWRPPRESRPSGSARRLQDQTTARSESDQAIFRRLGRSRPGPRAGRAGPAAPDPFQSLRLTSDRTEERLQPG